MTRLSDTSPEAERVLLEALRRIPFDRRLRRMTALYRTARLLHAAGYRDRHPGATPAQIDADWRASVPGWTGPQPQGGRPMTEQPDQLAVLQEVIGILTRLGVPYALGGSWASSLQGKPRFTYDADLTAEPFPGKERAFCTAFGEDYYVSLAAVQDANTRRSSFNIIHTTSGFKVDVFVRKDRPFEVSAMARRRAYPVPQAPGQEIVCVTPEDVILFKLEWYRVGGGTSERQWNDILGVLQVQAGRLDDAYLDRWAANLGVADLLRRARAEAVV